MPLTGGYRFTPVMQIGADIYCDTRLIARELERRFPTPPLFTSLAEQGLAGVVEAWAERAEPGLNADRAALRGKPEPSLARLQQVARDSLGQALGEIRRVDQMLGDGRAFLLGGKHPGLADLAVYHGLWFLDALPIRCGTALDLYPAIRAWMGRVAALGHGRESPFTAEQALDAAAA